MEARHYIEEITEAGEDLMKRVECIVQQGNARRIVVKQNGHTVAEFPLTAGVIGAALAPVAAAVGAVAAVLTHCTVEVERVDSINERECQDHKLATDTARDELERMLRDEAFPVA